MSARTVTNLVSPPGACTRAWMVRSAVKVLAASFLALGAEPTLAAEPSCALFVENSQLCFSRAPDSKECKPLDPRRYDEISHSRCLVRSFVRIRHCFGVTIAQNAFVRLDPFGIHYEEVFFPKGSRDLFSEDRIVSSCRNSVVR